MALQKASTIEKYQALGGTALYDALYNSIMRLKSVKGRRAVVILTDGRDEAGGVLTAQTIKPAARNSQTLSLSVMTVVAALTR